MKLIIITGILLLVYGCEKPSVSGSHHCWDNEYIIDDFGYMFSTYDLSGFKTYGCERGSITITTGSKNYYFQEDQLFGDFEIRTDALPEDEFTITFLDSTLYFSADILINETSTLVQESSNYCSEH